MAKTQSQLIDYFRRCYRADNYGIAISDVSRLSKTRRLEVTESDDLACGVLPRIPLVNPNVRALIKQVDKYRKERLLVYACFFVYGRIESNGSFSSSRNLNSPLIYFPATLFQDEDYYLKIDHTDLRVNRPLLRQLLKPELDTSALESFPKLKWPITADVVTQLTKWIRENTTIAESEELGRWPKLFNDPFEQSSAVTLKCTCSILFAERSKGSRGVLHELKALAEQTELSPALSQILNCEKVIVTSSRSEPDLIPGSLSKPQLIALDNAAKQTISMISGPPGTGKSYTIAAIAIDRMLHGESVLIVSKSDQAINVVGEKLHETYGLKQGYVHTPEANFIKSMKEYLESILSQGVEVESDLGKLQKKLNFSIGKLKKTSRAFDRKLAIFRWISTNIAQSTCSNFKSSLFHKLIRLLNRWTNPMSLWQYPDRIGSLTKETDNLSAQYINTDRQRRLNELLDSRRSEISKFLQALKARTSKTQEERFEQTNFNDVLAAFPIWLVNVNELNRVLPLKKSMFDVVIFDEATQCDIATSLPALYRAKRAVIVGDKKQLRHVSFVARTEQQALYEYCQLDPALSPQYSYRDQSVLDLASDVIQSQKAVCMLDEYYRGKIDLISFSNQHFYHNRLKVMRRRPGEIAEPALTFTKLDGERNKAGRNKKEADSVINHIKTHIASYENAVIKPSIGVLSPYREQAVYLEKEISKCFSGKDKGAHKIRVDTPYGFQGEERDLMLLSMSVDKNSSRAAAYLNRRDMFNVAITRAKERMHVYYSVDSETLSAGNLFKKFLEHDHLHSSYKNIEVMRCQFSNELSTILVSKGYKCWTGFEIAGVEIDLVCQKGGCLLGIDLIGFPGDFHAYYDVETYKILFRAGIVVLPMPYSAWIQDKNECIGMINTYIERT